MKKNLTEAFSLTRPKCSCIHVKRNGMVTKEYLQKQDGSNNLNVNYKTK